MNELTDKQKEAIANKASKQIMTIAMLFGISGARMLDALAEAYRSGATDAIEFINKHDTYEEKM